MWYCWAGTCCCQSAENIFKDALLVLPEIERERKSSARVINSPMSAWWPIVGIKIVQLLICRFEFEGARGVAVCLDNNSAALSATNRHSQRGRESESERVKGKASMQTTGQTSGVPVSRSSRHRWRKQHEGPLSRISDDGNQISKLAFLLPACFTGCTVY